MEFITQYRYLAIYLLLDIGLSVYRNLVFCIFWRVMVTLHCTNDMTLSYQFWAAIIYAEGFYNKSLTEIQVMKSMVIDGLEEVEIHQITL